MADVAPIIVAALFGDADQQHFDRLRRAHFPPERNQLAAHLTLFHHLPPSIGDELDMRLTEITRSRPAPAAESAGPMNLGRGVAIRISSSALETIRADLADAFSGVLIPQDRAGWRPHVTIQNKVDPAVARRLLEAMRDDLAPRPIAIAGLASFHYRGGPWEIRRRHLFARDALSRSGRPRRS